MTHSFHAGLHVSSARPAAATPSWATRLAALAGGLLLLLVGIVLSFGMVILGPIGMAVTSRVLRRRGRAMPAGVSWVAATASVGALLLLVGTLVFAMVPASTWQATKRSIDSASVEAPKEPPPAWLERLSPGSAQRSAQQPQLSPSVESAAMMAGFGFAFVFFVALYGTVAWGAGMLLGLAFKGRWPGAPAIPEMAATG